jgi:spore maturation protein CgeB
LSEILERLRSIGAGRRNQSWTLSVDALTDAVERYRSNGSVGWIRSVLIALFTAVFGRQRGPRAARRLVYELSWRLGGAVTYGARGLPGRLFYTES